MPVSLAWEAFGEGNGARSLIEVRQRIAKYRREPMVGNDDPVIDRIAETIVTADRPGDPV